MESATYTLSWLGRLVAQKSMKQIGNMKHNRRQQATSLVNTKGQFDGNAVRQLRPVVAGSGHCLVVLCFEDIRTSSASLVCHALHAIGQLHGIHKYGTQNKFEMALTQGLLAFAALTCRPGPYRIAAQSDILNMHLCKSNSYALLTCKPASRYSAV